MVFRASFLLLFLLGCLAPANVDDTEDSRDRGRNPGSNHDGSFPGGGFGDSNPTNTETECTEETEIDILWVVDNSDSMAAEQDKISNGFIGFLNQILSSELDYHIGVITTDPDENGELRVYDGPAVTGCVGCRFLTKDVSCDNPEVSITGLTEEQIEAELLDECHAQLVFRELIRAGVGGSPFEEGFTQAVTAIGLLPVSPVTGFPDGVIPQANVGFLREQASLHLIFVSDEDEGAKADGIPLNFFTRLFEGLKGIGNENKVTVSTITGWSSDTSVTADEVCGILSNSGHDMHGEVNEILQSRDGCTDLGAATGGANARAETGTRYIELACDTGGMVVNLCDQDYSAALSDLGANVTYHCDASLGCLTNADCLVVEGNLCESNYCKIGSGSCVSYCECEPVEGDICCTIDSHCAYNQICADDFGECDDGCRSSGDCIPGYGCTQIPVNGGVGVCVAGICTANNQCGYTEICNLATGECLIDSRGPYCEVCTGGVASEDCGDPGNYCLLDTTDPTGQSSFCGVNCAQGQACPNGFTCNQVIILPQSTPRCGVEICVVAEGQTSGYCSQNTTLSCTENKDCPMGPPGGDCPRRDVGNCLIDQTKDCLDDLECCDDPTACPEGSCVKQRCRGGEGSAYGVCSCTRDLDCPRDECRGADLTDINNAITGYCHLSGHGCLEDIDCDVIACVSGGCRLGANCTPGNDRSCNDIMAE